MNNMKEWKEMIANNERIKNDEKKLSNSWDSI